MRGFPCSARTFIPEALMLKRLEQSEQMRESFYSDVAAIIQMWLQNSVLAKQDGEQ